MGPGYFVIAIMGCADGAATCTPVATAPTHYATEAACAAATPGVLARNTDLDFPTLLAECRATNVPAAAPAERAPSPEALVFAARG